MKTQLLIPLTFTLILNGFLTACSSKTLPNYTNLGDLRILALVTDLPEVNPGTTVTFTPVISDLNGGGRALNFSIQGCLDPGIGVGRAPACTTPDPAATQNGTVTPAAGASATYTGAVATFTVTMPNQATALALRSQSDQYNGIAYLVFYTLSVPGGASSVTAMKRVIISTATKVTKNTNPAITSIDLNDVASAATIAIPSGPVNFRVTSPSSSAESYSVMKADGSFISETETLTTTWFLSDATFRYFRTLANGENLWTPPSDRPPGRGMVILAVTRDGRGGEAFQKIDLN